MGDQALWGRGGELAAPWSSTYLPSASMVSPLSPASEFQRHFPPLDCPSEPSEDSPWPVGSWRGRQGAYGRGPGSIWALWLGRWALERQHLDAGHTQPWALGQEGKVYRNGVSRKSRKQAGRSARDLRAHPVGA